VIKLRRIRRAGRTARIWKEDVYNFYWEMQKESGHLMDLAVDGWIILIQIFDKHVVKT
jgi:hypothetical protein